MALRQRLEALASNLEAQWPQIMTLVARYVRDNKEAFLRDEDLNEGGRGRCNRTN